MLRQPKGLVAVTDSPITNEELEEFFDVIEPNWPERIADARLRPFDRPAHGAHPRQLLHASRAASGSVA